MRSFLSILLALLFSGISAQNLSITSFRPLETDITANTAGTTVIDQNGNKCALIKVVTTQTGFMFDVGVLGVRETKQQPGEIWVYVPAGVKRITISHQNLGSIRDQDLGYTLQAGKTYLMELKSANVTTIIEEQVTMQYLVFKLNPTNAIVMLEGPGLESTAMSSDDGAVSKYLKFGTYTYTAQAAGYHSQSGTVQINNPDSKHTLSIDLLPAFGYLSIPATGNLASSTVSIDNEIIGTTPVTSHQLASGTHTILITKPKYKTYKSQITIEDGKTLTLDSPLQANFASLTITAVEGSEIWINGNLAGKSPWTGDLEYGPYSIECRKPNHRTSTKSFEFAPGVATTLTLTAPTPIYGTLTIDCTPTIANVSIDGQPYGETPIAINKLLIGSHTLRITKQGYGDYTQSIIITEGKTETISAKLQNSVPVSLSTTASNPRITLDNTSIESLSSIKSLSIGDHTITITAADYKPFTQTFTVSQNSSNTFTFSPEQNFAGQTFTVNGVSFKMIAVQGGTFTMGATSEQGSSAESDEKPAHSVTLSSYHIGETEVTQELWEAVMGSNPSNFKGSQNPVEQVSWQDCQQFISRLNSLTGKNFRLPTEAEWEFAARGGNKSRVYKYSGSNDIGSVAWYTNNSGGKTHSVKTKQPNELGIYDMSGNVYEWCNDWYGSYKSGSVNNPTGPSSSSYRVFRGGYYYYDASYCRVSDRNYNVPSYRLNFLGLRLGF